MINMRLLQSGLAQAGGSECCFITSFAVCNPFKSAPALRFARVISRLPLHTKASNTPKPPKKRTQHSSCNLCPPLCPHMWLRRFGANFKLDSLVLYLFSLPLFFGTSSNSRFANFKLRPPARFLLLQFLWIVPYLFLANYLERSLLPFRLFCYINPDFLSTQRPIRMNTQQCIGHFFPHQQIKRQPSCLLNRPLKVLLEPSGLRTLHNNTRVLVVRSAPRHNTYRNYIRQTWKKEINAETPVIFVSGRDEYNNEELDRESRQFNDILQLDFIDSYRNLTLKMMNIYRHMLETTNATQIIVINDDTIVNASALKEVLNNAETNYPNTPYIVGKVSRGYPRLIFPWLPWYVPSAVYPNKCYPVFTQGSSFVISAQAASRILERICDFPTIHLDDVMMGVVSNCLSIRNIHRQGFDHPRTDKFVVFHYQYSRYSPERLHTLYRETKK